MTTAERIQHCPLCGYEIRGLPEAHTCPECGFEYDEHSVAFTVLPRFSVSDGVLCAIVTAATPIVSNALTNGPWAFSVIACSTFLLSAIVLFRMYLHRRKLAVGPRTVGLRIGAGPVLLIPLSEIDLERDRRSDRTIEAKRRLSAIHMTIANCGSPSMITAAIARRQKTPLPTKATAQEGDAKTQSPQD